MVGALPVFGLALLLCLPHVLVQEKPSTQEPFNGVS